MAGVAALGDLRAGRDRAVEPEARGERLDEIGERGRDDDRSLATRLMRPHARDRVGKCERRQRVDLLGDELAQFRHRPAAHEPERLRGDARELT